MHPRLSFKRFPPGPAFVGHGEPSIQRRNPYCGSRLCSFSGVLDSMLPHFNHQVFPSATPQAGRIAAKMYGENHWPGEVSEGQACVAGTVVGATAVAATPTSGHRNLRDHSATHLRHRFDQWRDLLSAWLVLLQPWRCKRHGQLCRCSEPLIDFEQGYEKAVFFPDNLFILNGSFIDAWL